MTGQDKPCLLGVGRTDVEERPLTDGLEWLQNRIVRFIKGGVYSLASQSGIGKSTMAIQLALDLGRQGHRSVYVLIEQSREELAQRAHMIMTWWPSKDIETVLYQVEPVEAVYDIENLPSFLMCKS